MKRAAASRQPSRGHALAVLAALASALALAGCGGSSDQGAARPAAPPPPAGAANSAKPTLEDLTTVGEFRSRFNEDKGTPRLVLLLAPT